jgi:hypothetical protein
MVNLIKMFHVKNFGKIERKPGQAVAKPFGLNMARKTCPALSIPACSNCSSLSCIFFDLVSPFERDAR